MIGSGMSPSWPLACMPPSHGIVESMHGWSVGGCRTQVSGTSWTPKTWSDWIRSDARRPSLTTWYIGRISRSGRSATRQPAWLMPRSL